MSNIHTLQNLQGRPSVDQQRNRIEVKEVKNYIDDLRDIARTLSAERTTFGEVLNKLDQQTVSISSKIENVNESQENIRKQMRDLVFQVEDVRIKLEKTQTKLKAIKKNPIVTSREKLNQNVNKQIEKYRIFHEIFMLHQKEMEENDKKFHKLNKRVNRQNKRVNRHAILLAIAFIALFFLNQKIDTVSDSLIKLDQKTTEFANQVGDYIEAQRKTNANFEKSILVLDNGYRIVTGGLDALGSTVNELQKQHKAIEVTVGALGGLKYTVDSLYMTVVEHSSTIKVMDEKLVKIHGHRAWYFLGCFAKGTLINISHNETVPIEDLYTGDLLWNPDTNSSARISKDLAGPESGFIWEFITEDGFSLNVTKSHPMKIERFDLDASGSILTERWKNVAAADVFVGDVTQTVNGKKAITSIRKIEVKDFEVFNLQFGFENDDEVPITMRSLVANGIVTFDLLAQSANDHKLSSCFFILFQKIVSFFKEGGKRKGILN